MGNSWSRVLRAPRLFMLALAALACALSLAVGVPDADGAARKPAQVTGVTLSDARVSGSKGSIKVSWRKAAGAKTYQVLWSTSKKMKKARSTTVRKKKFTARGLAQGKTWCFQVRAVSGKKKGKKSAPVCARLAKPGQAAAPSVVAQRLVGTPARTELTLRWRAVAGATAYELDFAVTKEPVGNYNLWENKARRTIKVGTNAAVLGGLLPGTIYCFQVRALTSAGVGTRSPTHCKVTMPADAGVPAGPSVGLDVATWNICAAACNRGIGGRIPGIRDRILAMDVDVVGTQESTFFAADYLKANLTGFQEGCRANAGAQALYVRSSDYSILAGSAGSYKATQRSTHGACWVEIQDQSGYRVVVVSLHLINVKGLAEDKLRQSQMTALRKAIRTDRPGVPIVFAGDSNSTRSRDLDGPRLAVADSHYDAYDIAASYRSPTKENSANSWSTTPRDSVRWGDHIDRVFAPRGAHAASWQVVEPKNSAGKFSNLLSDHSPVRVSLLLPTS